MFKNHDIPCISTTILSDVIVLSIYSIWSIKTDCNDKYEIVLSASLRLAEKYFSSKASPYISHKLWVGLFVVQTITKQPSLRILTSWVSATQYIKIYQTQQMQVQLRWEVMTRISFPRKRGKTGNTWKAQTRELHKKDPFFLPVAVLVSLAEASISKKASALY